MVKQGEENRNQEFARKSAKTVQNKTFTGALVVKNPPSKARYSG